MQGTPAVVHLELHTPDLPSARRFYSGLFGGRSERIETGHGSYLALDLGGRIGGGLVECGVERPLWLPYIEVEAVHPATERARALGAAVLLEPREGPTGWRSVVAGADGTQVALWQHKEAR